MRYILLFSLVISLSAIINGQMQNNLDGFRDSNWGDSIIKIRLKETADQVDSISYKNFALLVYKDKIVDRNALIYYGFHNDHLLFGAYIFLDDHTDNKSLYFNDFKMVKDIISARYGTPSDDQWIAKNNDINLYKENPNLAGSALALGILELKSSWNLPEGSIILSLKQENGISIKVNYLSSSFLNNFDLSNVSSIEQDIK